MGTLLKAPDLVSLDLARLTDGRVLYRNQVEASIDGLIDQILTRDKGYFQAHRERFCETLLRLAPHVHPEMKLLVAGDWICFFNALCEDLLGLHSSAVMDQKDGKIGFRLSSGREVWFDRASVDLEREPWPAGDGSFDLVVSMEIIEHLGSDPMHFMVECNRVLREGGLLLTTTPNANSLQAIWNCLQGQNPFSFGVFGGSLIEHPKEYAIRELALMHQNAGFETVSHQTFSPYGKPEIPELREALAPLGLDASVAGQVQFLLARKTGLPIYRKYAPLYRECIPFRNPDGGKPDLQALNHQWWGKCPFAEPAEERAAATKEELPGNGAVSAPSAIRSGWPYCTVDKETLHLIRACVLQGEQAFTAFTKWHQTVNLDTLNHEQIKLLPHLYLRLRYWGLTNLPEFHRLKGIHRYFWVKTHMVLKDKAQLLSWLQEQGVPTLLIKGAALNTQVYRKPELRPMDDFDFLVPGNCAGQAIELIEKLGWKLMGRVPISRKNAEFAEYLHALAFESSRDGAILDLHWHLSLFHLRPEDDTFFWDRSESVAFGSGRVRTLGPEDHVLHLIVHQVQYSSHPGLLWPLDVALILQRREFDWDKLIQAAEHSRMALAVHKGLQFLRDEVGLGDLIPLDCIRTLRKRGTAGERLELRCARKPLPSRSTFRQRFPFNALIYLRLSRSWSLWKRWRHFDPYMRVVNFYDYSPLLQWMVHAARAIRHYRVRLREWRCLCETQDKAGINGDIRDFPEHHLKGFHLLEPYRGRSLRWTECKASVRLDLEPLCYQGRVEIASMWPDAELNELPARIKMRFNSSPVSVVRREKAHLYFRIEKSWFAKGTMQTLLLEAPPFDAPQDARELGLAILAIEFIRLGGE